MSKESRPTTEELEKYLKDAGVYEENMNFESMLGYYKVIKCSENTAKAEQEKRNVKESLQDKTKVKDSKTKMSGSSLSNVSFDDDISDDQDQSPITKSPKLSGKSSAARFLRTKSSVSKSEEKSNKLPRNEIEYDMFDCPSLKHKSLDVIFYERKYDLPPHCNPKYSKLSILQRAKLIRNFHKVVLGRFYKFHCESLTPAPWGKPIPSSEKFSGTLDRKFDVTEDDSELTSLNNVEENIETQEIYTSRSGRQTKRKIYIDEIDEDNDFKKSKKDDDKPFEVEKKSNAKRQNANKLSNQDIMKRSKLFSDSGKSTTTTFDLLKQDDKKIITDKEAESTNDNLKLSVDGDDVIESSQESNNEVEIKPKESLFVPRRIPPPIRGRRGIGSKRQLDFSKSNSSTSSTSMDSKVVPSTVSVSPERKIHKAAATKTKCPICSEIFFQEEIEEHASSCGLPTETESNFDMLLSSGSLNKISCNVCDKEFIMNKEYEVHVKECIKKASEVD